MTRPAELASFNVAHSDDAIMHHPRDTLKDLTLAEHVITITTHTPLVQCFASWLSVCKCKNRKTTDKI